MAHHPHFIWRDLFKKKKPLQSLQDTLQNNILFSTLTRAELRYLSNFVYERVYQTNEAIFRQNDRGLGMYLISKGRVAIKTQSSQNELLVTTLGEGSFFGELALIDGNHNRTASAYSLEKCTVIGFFKPDLEEIIERKPAMGVKIMSQLCVVLGRRLLETTEKLSQISRPKGVSISHEEAA